MTTRINLRYRVAFIFLIFGGIISSIMGAGLYWLTITMEERLIEESLSIELDDYIIRYNNDKTALPPSSKNIKTFVHSSNQDKVELPEELHNLQEGLHHLEMNQSGYYIEVREDGLNRFFLAYNDAQIQIREYEYLLFLIICIILMTLLSGALGLWLAGRVIQPVTKLANHVVNLRPEEDTKYLVNDYHDDELGDLAKAFDKYHSRLNAFIERERSFTGDISHELRTPLAVIEGATEILNSDKTLSDKSKEKIKRITRSISIMKRLTTALLTLAREEENILTIPANCRIDDIVNDIIRDYQHLINHKPVEVTIHTNNSFEVQADPSLLYVVISNIIANAYSFTSKGQVEITIDQDTVTVADTGMGMKKQELDNIYQRHFTSSEKSGVGIGMSLVKRISDLYGWDIQIISNSDKGSQIAINFSGSRLL